MPTDPTRNRLTFLPRSRGEGGSARHAGPVVPVEDLAFHVGTGRVAVLRVTPPGQASTIVEALFTVPQRSGGVGLPPPQSLGWVGRDPSGAGLRWASAIRGAEVVDCTGRRLGQVAALVVDHLRQRVTDLLLDDDSRVPVADAAFLGTERVLVEADTHLRGALDLWLAWQQDLEHGLLWWRDGFETPPPLQPLAAAAL